MPAAPDLAAAATAVELAKHALHTSARHLAATGGEDEHQSVVYDLAHAAAAVENARAVLDYGAKGDVEARIACAFVADALFDVVTKTYGREAEWGLDVTHPRRHSRRHLGLSRSVLPCLADRRNRSPPPRQ